MGGIINEAVSAWARGKALCSHVFSEVCMLFKREKYRVKMQGRAGIVYQENGRSMLIDSEMLAGPEFDIVIYTDTIEPLDTAQPREKEIARIKGNIAKSLNNLRIDWQ